MLKRHWYLIAFIGWMMFVTFSSLYAFKGTHVGFFNFSYGDKIVHFIFYFIAGVLGLMYLSKAESDDSLQRTKLLKLVIFLILFGTVIEVIQETFTATRTGDIADALANSIGAICGVFIINALFYGQRRLK